MAQKGEDTKQAIMDVAQAIILQKGFSGTSIDEIIAEVGITKGGFFYHFKGRNELARQLLERYLEEDDRILNELTDRAQSLSDDPLQRVLIFLKLYSETMADLPGVHPGCLVASYTYEAQQFDPGVVELAREGVRSWKKRFIGHLDAVLEEYESDRNADEVADMLNAILEGGIILSKLEGRQDILVQQIMQFRDYVKMIFRPKSAS